MPLPDEITHPLIGNLLGDGSLQFQKKKYKEGKGRENTNALLAFTLKFK